MATDHIAILVSGYPLAPPASSNQSEDSLGGLARLLHASADGWRVVRLGHDASALAQPSTSVLKHHIDRAIAEQASRLLMVMACDALVTESDIRIVTGAHPELYPQDATLSLRWLAGRLATLPATWATFLKLPQGTGEAALSTFRATNRELSGLVAVQSDPPDPDVLSLLSEALSGAALDRNTGTITMASLASYLSIRAVPHVAAPSTSTDWFCPPPYSVLRASGVEPSMPLLDPIERELALGMVLPGKLRILEEIARGGFGTVYRARQITVERDVAVKILHPEHHPTSEEGALFLAEIQMIGRLRHPNVVQIHHADVTTDGRLFFAMELLEGITLRQLLSTEGTLPPARATSLIGQVLAGVGAAHDGGVVHADLKPDNIIVATTAGQERAVVVDFGLSRLIVDDGQTAEESVGGTFAYMSPEQMYSGRVDERADIYAVGLILLELLTGWRRASFADMQPDIDALSIADRALRDALRCALASDPDDRYLSVAAFSAALTGEPTLSANEETISAPFRGLVPFSEREATNFFGRETELAELLDRVLTQRLVVYTGPSGVGKTSLLRAGLTPQLAMMQIRCVYTSCRGTPLADIMRDLGNDGATLTEAYRQFSQQEPDRPLIIIFDQLEQALLGTSAHVLEAIVDLLRNADHLLCVVLSLREDFLAYLLDHNVPHAGTRAVLRLGPLTRNAAKAAIDKPLKQHRMTIAPELLQRLLDDLERATDGMRQAFGWRQGVHPAHVQLAASVIYRAADDDTVELEMQHYRAVGGMAAIIGEHFERVLDHELSPDRTTLARNLFSELVTVERLRRRRDESELVAALSSQHDSTAVQETLGLLQDHGLLLSAVAENNKRFWELPHDSLVNRILSWMDARDLARRSAKELIAYRLRRSTTETPSVLSREEIRDVLNHQGVVAELEQERSHAGAIDQGWTPSSLLAHSRRALSRRRTSLAAAAIAVLATISALSLNLWQKQQYEERQAALRAQDMGQFRIILEPFDWDAQAHKASAVSLNELPSLSWRIVHPRADDPESPNLQQAPPIQPYLTDKESSQLVQARAGPAFIEISGRGRDEKCAPSLIRLRWLPGYSQRDTIPTWTLRVPTCRATATPTVHVPAGTYYYSGPGDPPTRYPDYIELEQVVEVQDFFIDRTEVTNAAYAHYAGMAVVTGREMPAYPKVGVLVHSAGSDRPVANVDWMEARDYCRYMGKALPTNHQWEKAARGGIWLSAEMRNPAPRRLLPWYHGSSANRANLKHCNDAPSDPLTSCEDNPVISDGYAGVAPVGAFPAGASPYGVLDLSGNVYEWTASQPEPTLKHMRITRGGSFDMTPTLEVHTIAHENMRDRRFVRFDHGFRCALNPPASATPPRKSD